MKKINEIINNEYDNHIMPFLWMHGEDEDVIREYITKIYESGIKSVCIESRPHEEFLKEKWWTDVSIILNECEKHDMTVWILDDKHFPTGYAAGKIESDYPQFQKLFLDFYQLDVVGPKQNIGTLIRWTTQKRPNFMSVGTEEEIVLQENSSKGKILSIVAAPKIDHNQINEKEIIDISKYLKGDMLYWDIPEGHWSIFVCFETSEGGEAATKGYLNPLVAEATDILINTVYEAHYNQFSDKFGSSIEGFFSDEPRFGNIKGPNAVIGEQDMPLPWRPGMFVEFAEHLKIDKKELAKKLLLLRKGSSEEAKSLRYSYMNYVTDLYKDNFTNRIGKWCENHGVKYIGHVIEDNNAHGRLGYGAGHFFKSMAGQDMAGIDVVLHQLLPDQNQGYFQSMTANGWDGEFFHYALAKLGSSLAYLDPKKQGRTMCEVFGAYGWAEGTKLMKWIADHMLVRGVNYFVPHAFTMKKFPDPDCPPHFYAHGENPQFFGFSELMHYVNKVSHIFSDGQHYSDVAVLYNAESEWAGETMLIQKVTKVLTENQVEFDIVSCEMIEESQYHENYFSINQSEFKVIVIPYSEYLPQRTIEKLALLAAHGVSVLFIESLPVGSCEQVTVINELKELARIAEIIPLLNLVKCLVEKDVDQLRTVEQYSNIRYFHYEQEQQSVYMIFNESMLSDTIIYFEDRFDGQLLLFDPTTNKIKDIKRLASNYELKLSKGEAVILFEAIEGNDYCVEEASPSATTCYSLNEKEWTLSIEGKGASNKELYPKTFQSLPLLGVGDDLEDFSGKITYETTIKITETVKVAHLSIENANEIISLYINGEKTATRISYPYTFDVTNSLIIGENTIKIEVTNNLGRYMKDFLSQYLDFEPLGLIGEIKLELIG